MNELKPCPFCGGEAETLTAESMHGGYLFGIMCNDCRSRGDVYDTEAEAIAAWNTRAERTCKIDPIVKQVNGTEWTGFKCDTCLYWGVSPFAGLASASGRFKYCPNCGARVVGE